MRYLAIVNFAFLNTALGPAPSYFLRLRDSEISGSINLFSKCLIYNNQHHEIPILLSMRALIINLKVKIEGHIKKMKVLKL